VQVIEAINLFLAGEFPNCIFVVAMEPDVVAAHIEAVYKDLAARPSTESSTLGWRFLQKIVQLPLSLPPLDPARQTPRYLDSLLNYARSARAVPASRPSGARTDPERPADRGARAERRMPVDSMVPAETTDRAQRVRMLEIAIRSRRPTTETLAAAALEAQAEIMPEAGGTLAAETAEAANRVLVEVYSDREARTAILAGVPGLAAENPREIKRFVNLFRFYSFVAQQQRLQGLPTVAGPEIAKLAVLAIRWPHLLGLFGRPGILLALEESARRGTWAAGMQHAGLPATGGWTEELRLFLIAGPPIAAVADRLL
jgi:hypothetical protein